MADITGIREGWDFMSSILGGDYSSNIAMQDFSYETSTNAHIQEINAAIDQLRDKINYHPGINLDIEKFKGFVAEEWAAETFNIDAITDGSSHRATTLHSTAYGSVDIGTNFGKDYSVKYYKNAAETAKAQATYDSTAELPKYHNQDRLVPTDQLEEAKKFAEDKAKDIAGKRPAVAASYKEAADKMVDRVSDNDGHSSRPLSKQESLDIAKEAKSREGFDPAKHGYEKLDKIQLDYIKNGLQAGVTAATITAIMQITPELFKAVDYLIKNGEIDLSQIGKSGAKVITTSGESFLRGTTAYAVEMSIQKGLLGETLQQAVTPTAVGVAVVVVMNTIRNSLLVAAGKKSPAKMGEELVDTVVMTTGYLVGAKIGGAIAQTVAFELPGLAYILGSMIGCSVAAVYFIGKKRLISLCVDTGFTCFGLVEQDYELPDEVLESMGIDMFKIPEKEIDQIPIKTINVHQALDVNVPETIDLTMVKRGIIGVNKVGYVIA